MTLLWPPLLLLLLVVPVLVAAYLLSLRRRRPAGVRYSSLSLIREAIPRRSRIRQHLPFVFFAAAVAALGIAVARPAVTLSVPSNETTIILTLDVSGSMCSSDISPNRLLAAEAAAQQFIESQSSSTLIGIVAFSGFAEIVQPPTADRQALLDALHSLTTGRRTAVGSGIRTSIDAIAGVDPTVPRSVAAGRPGTAPVPVTPGSHVPDIVVLLTDGASNTGPDPLEAAQQAADRGIRVFTIGFGTADGGALTAECARQFIGREPNQPGPGGFGQGGGFGGGGFGRRGIDEDALRQIAGLTGGSYHPAESAGELQQVFRDLPTNLIVRTEATEIGFAFVAFGGVAAALAFLLGRAWRPLS
jgi:Ca-activated chloride channel family protein